MHVYAFGPQVVPQSMGESFCLSLRFSRESKRGRTCVDVVYHVSIFLVQLQHSYRKLYLILDNGTLTFTGDPHEVYNIETMKVAQTKSMLPLALPHPPTQGISYLVSLGVLEDSSQSIAEFIHHTTALDWNSLRRFLQDRYAQ